VSTIRFRRRRPRPRHTRSTIRVEPVQTAAIPSPTLVGTAGAESAALPEPPLSPELFADLPLEAPDLSEALTAFRRWRVVDGRLRSPYLPVFWDERVLPARCYRQESGESLVPAHTPPFTHCSCGIHAYNEPDLDFPAVDYRGVTGIVTIRGKVAIGPDGMRAELARVEALGVYSRWSRRQRREVLALADRLGIDLVDLDDLADAAQRYGRLLLPDSMPTAGAGENVSMLDVFRGTVGTTA
jgi:hypothetical protein